LLSNPINNETSPDLNLAMRWRAISAAAISTKQKLSALVSPMKCIRLVGRNNEAYCAGYTRLAEYASLFRLTVCFQWITSREQPFAITFCAE
jgi:hypothetical protein